MRIWLIVAGLVFSLAFGPAGSNPTLSISSNTASLEFPDRVTFALNARSDTDIQRAVLEYGVANELTCGQVVAKAFPDLGDPRKIDLQWTWEMRQSGSQPPGAIVWWQWRLVDGAGHETVTDRKQITWLDSDRKWQSIAGGNINLHWYAGGQSLGRDLHNSAVASLKQLRQETGLQPDQPIDLYIYGSNSDLKDAVLFEPGWTGGLAYPNYNITIIGISPDQLDWGRHAQAHELTHVLVGHLTFSCLGIVPTWLNEGLAVYGEGGPDDASQGQLQQAIAADTLLPVRSLSAGFSEDPGKANLSYSQSYSLVNFLISKFGRDKIIQLLTALRDSATVDSALQQVYGFDIDGFEAAWRAAVGAPARPAATATPHVQPTAVPTFSPITGALLVNPPTSAPLPTERPQSPATLTPTTLPPLPDGSPALPNVPPVLLVLGVLSCCGVGLVGLGAVVLGLQSRKGGSSS